MSRQADLCLVYLQAIETAVSHKPNTAETLANDVERFIQTHGDEMGRIESGLRWVRQVSSWFKG